MGMHERIDGEHGNGGEDLPQRFVAMCVETWGRYRQPRDVLAPAMLAHALNLMLEDGPPDEVAAILRGIASEISTPREIGHA
jgi:hypothetical protein